MHSATTVIASSTTNAITTTVTAKPIVVAIVTGKDVGRISGRMSVKRCRVWTVFYRSLCIIGVLGTTAGVSGVGNSGLGREKRITFTARDRY